MPLLCSWKWFPLHFFRCGQALLLAVRPLPETGPAPRVELLQAWCLTGGGELRDFLLRRPPIQPGAYKYDS